MSFINQFKEIIDYSLFSFKNDDLYNRIFISQKRIDNLYFPNNLNLIIKDPSSKTKINKLKVDVQKKIDDLKKQLLNSKGREKTDLTKRIDDLKQALKELKIIKSSLTQYEFIVNSSKPRFEYDDSNNKGRVYYNGTTSGFLNELKHAFQFETGQIDFIQVAGQSINVPGLLYDLTDEIETYKRQYSYDGYLKLRVTVNEEDILQHLKSNATKKSLGLGILEIKKMKEITAEIVIKITDKSFSNSDVLYNTISKKNLNIHSPIKDIINNNKVHRNNMLNGLNIYSEDRKKPYIEFVKVFIKSNPYIYVKY